jgi:YegS/Rv2252/BmrU family lipid kinase
MGILKDMTKRALLLVNRHARRGRDSFAQAVDLLTDLEFELISVPVKKPNEIAAAIEKYGPTVDVVIIGGGDGTLNQAIESLLKVDRPLGILPLGTANDLARTLGIPADLPAACLIIAQANSQLIDLGWVNEQYFFNVASLGLSVDITQKLTRGAKRRWGILAYGMTALQVIGQNRPFHCDIICNGETISVKTIQVAIGNGRFYGGGMAIAEDAAIDDNRLHIYSLELQHWWQLFSLILTLRQGSHHQYNWVRSLEAESLEIRTRRPRAINTDGEIVTRTPAHFRVISKALRVFVPNPQPNSQPNPQPTESP